MNLVDQIALTETQNRIAAEAIRRMSEAFLADVAAQIDPALQPAVIRGVCGMVVGLMVGTGQDPAALDEANAIARAFIAGDFDLPAGEAPPG